MKKIDPEQLSKDIEAIPVCSKAKNMIKALFANNFDVNFPVPVPIKMGQIRHKKNGEIFMVGNVFSNEQKQTMNVIYLRTGIIHTQSFTSVGWEWVEECPVIAESFEKYVTERF